MSNAVAVIIGDIHMTPATLDVATSALNQALRTAEELSVPCVLNGDTLDTKAVMRAEVVNRLLDIVKDTRSDCKIIVSTGNHDLINEKADRSSLEFLKPYAAVISEPAYFPQFCSHVVPYFSDAGKLKEFLDSMPSGERLIMHQGVQTAFMGHYAQDKTSLSPASFAPFRVVASHYHRRQDIVTGSAGPNKVGTFSYIGNPYSLNFGEAEDGPKGFSVLYDDGSLRFVDTHLRRHKVIETSCDEIHDLMINSLSLAEVAIDDLVWLKVRGTHHQLADLDKTEIGNALLGHPNYKLDKIYTDQPALETVSPDLSSGEVFDMIIDSSNDSSTQKMHLKWLWKELV